MSNGPQVITLKLGELQTNCYIAFCPETRECIVIDPADSGETISNKILDEKLKPLAIIFTHGHFDHILGSLELKLNFSLPIMMHKKDLFLVKSVQNRASHWLQRSTDPVPSPSIFLTENSVIPVGKEELLVIETPGHTPGSISLVTLNPTRNKKHDNVVFPDEPILFSGDTLFQDGVGRADRSYSSPKSLKRSLKKLFSLPENTIVYPGHGPTTFIGSAKY